MVSLLSLVLCLTIGLAVLTGFAFAGFAIWEDSGPRRVWDCYVIALCAAVIVLSWPAAKWLGRIEAAKFIAVHEHKE